MRHVDFQVSKKYLPFGLNINARYLGAISRYLALLIQVIDRVMIALPVDPQCRIHLVNRDKCRFGVVEVERQIVFEGYFLMIFGRVMHSPLSLRRSPITTSYPSCPREDNEWYIIYYLYPSWSIKSSPLSRSTSGQKSAIGEIPDLLHYGPTPSKQFPQP
jgi:hypothetical protein